MIKEFICFEECDNIKRRFSCRLFRAELSLRVCGSVDERYRRMRCWDGEIKVLFEQGKLVT